MKSSVEKRIGEEHVMIEYRRALHIRPVADNIHDENENKNKKVDAIFSFEKIDEHEDERIDYDEWQNIRNPKAQRQIIHSSFFLSVM
jgi:hypothetical protein